MIEHSSININNQYWYKNKYVRTEWLLILMPVLYSFGYIYQVSHGMVLSFASAVIYLVCLYLIKKNTAIKTNIQTTVYCLAIYATLSLAITISYNYNGYRGILLNPALYLPYISILIAIKRFDFYILRIIFVVSLISAALFALYTYYNFASLNEMSGREAINYLSDKEISFDDVSKNLAACLGLLILLSPCMKKKYMYIVIITFLVNFSIAIYLGRRNIIFTNGMFLILSILGWLRYKNLHRIVRRVLYVVIIIAISFVFNNAINFLQKTDSEFLKVLSVKIDADTRGHVIDAYYDDMNSNYLNWILGKGIESTYYCPGVEETTFRHTVEAGWQHIILKLGVIWFFLYMLLQFIALMTKKTNLLLFACTSYIIISIVELYPAGVPAFHLRYVLIWVCVSICLDMKYRSLSQKSIYNLINNGRL